MDFRRLEHLLRQEGNGFNGSRPVDLRSITPNLLNVLVPGYSLVSGIASTFFGFDISILVTYGLFLLAIVSGWSYIQQRLTSSLKKHGMCYVVIQGHDDLYNHVLAYISAQRMTKDSRRLIAVSNGVGQAEDEESLNQYMSKDGLFHFGQWAAQKPPRYEPAVGAHWFWYKHRPFLFERIVKESHYAYQKTEEYLLTVRCVGRSTAPLKAWLEYVKVWSAEQKTALTTIRRPSHKEVRRMNQWTSVTSRPSRPISTVILDEEQKRRVIADINEYLHPASTKWYATRGIPYRRGYLFHGPPGTGKSSLSFALAGVFGLDIFVVSLNEQGPGGVTESELNTLFHSLPKRCIVLLEDIDAAGMKREEATDDKESRVDGTAVGRDSNYSDIRDLARELGKMSQRKRGGNDGSDQAISLSGLLNAIDGVASHEGRVLVMTTNHPEKLDDALIRPGRIDMQIGFTLASKRQARDIYFRMYEDGGTSVASKIHTEHLKVGALPKAKDKKSDPLELKLPNDLTPPLTPDEPESSGLLPYSYLQLEPEELPGNEELAELAKRFADQVPDEKLSPAELQSFLIVRKKRPRQAVEEFAAWRDALLETKAEGGKVHSKN